MDDKKPQVVEMPYMLYALLGYYFLSGNSSIYDICRASFASYSVSGSFSFDDYDIPTLLRVLDCMEQAG